MPFPGSSHDGGAITGATVEHGLHLENRHFVASAEEAYTRSKRAVDSSQWRQLLSPTTSSEKLLTSGSVKSLSPPANQYSLGNDNNAENKEMYCGEMEELLAEGYSPADPSNEGDEERPTSDLIEETNDNYQTDIHDMLQSPFGEHVMSSTNANYAHGGKMGEFNYMHHYKMKTDPTFLQIPELYPESLVSRKIERMLLDVLAAPVPIEAKRKEVLELCGICLSQKLYLQGQSMESLFSFLSCYTSKDIYEARRLSLPQIEGNDSSPPYTLIPLYNPLPLMQSMYFHMRSTFAAPTTVMMELLMEVTHRNVMQLEDARRNEESRLALSGTTYKGLSHGERDIKTRQLSNRPIFQRKGYDLYNFAHRIIADSERFAVLFSRKTYVMYFDLCAHFDDMGTALWRLSHIQERLNITPSPQMLCSVQRGLLKNGNVEEALMFVGKISKVELTLPLLNSTLEIFLMSSDPRACFTVMESIRENADSMYSVTPNEETFSLLLLACESMNEWSEAPRLLREMQVLKIRGDITCLNLMLKGLLKNGLNEYAFQLRRVMIKKKIQVWPQLDEGVSELFPKDSALNQTRRGTDYVNFKDAGNALIKGTDNTFTSSSSLDVSSSTVDLTDSFYDILPVEERKLITCDNGADIDNIEDSVTETVHPSDLDNRSKRYHDRDTTSHATIGVWDIDETGSIDRLDDVSIIDKKISMNIFNTVSPDELKEMTTPKDYFNAANDATASVESEVKPLTRQRRCKLSGKGSNGLRAISAARPTHPAYVTPMSYSQLQSLLRAGKGATIDRDYLISFLNKKGVNMSQEQRR